MAAVCTRPLVRAPVCRACLESWTWAHFNTIFGIFGVCVLWDNSSMNITHTHTHAHRTLYIMSIMRYYVLLCNSYIYTSISTYPDDDFSLHDRTPCSDTSIDTSQCRGGTASRYFAEMTATPRLSKEAESALGSIKVRSFGEISTDQTMMKLC